MGLIGQHSNDATTLKLTFSSLLLICKIFRSLNAQVRYFKYVYIWIKSKIKLWTSKIIIFLYNIILKHIL